MLGKGKRAEYSVCLRAIIAKICDRRRKNDE